MASPMTKPRINFKGNLLDKSNHSTNARGWRILTREAQPKPTANPSGTKQERRHLGGVDVHRALRVLAVSPAGMTAAGMAAARMTAAGVTATGTATAASVEAAASTARGR